MAKLGKQAPKAELRKAIKEMCVHCMGGCSIPGYQEEIRHCSADICPLKPYRPYKEKRELGHE